ncbi:MAG: MBL fold metallo-hydrolase [Deltaproteobacteria bacterium]|nr:MBL fold metallo-hydrolase [Deltaproteobacteria bacterium]
MPEIVACTPVHPLSDGEVRLLGAIDVVTGSMSRADLGGKKLLVDCGVTQGRDPKRKELPEEALEADALLITHGHLDHIGSLPQLLDAGFDKPIFCTRATYEICRISLQDSMRMARLPDREIVEVLRRLEKLTRTLAYDVAATVHGMQGTITFRDAGHILGSASVEIVTDKSRVIFSGDLGRPNRPILRDANSSWKGERDVDLVIMETTYGARSHEHSHEDIEKTLERIVNDAWKRRAKVLIPAFAIGRTQVLLWFLSDLVEKGRIPEIPVALDTPMGLLVTETYKRAKRLYDRETLDRIQHGDDPLDFDSLFTVKSGKDSFRLRNTDGAMIVIAGSGMCTGGRIVGHLMDGLPDPETTVLFVGHQGAGTPGRRIQEVAAAGGGTVRIDGEELPVRARIEVLRGLSAHMDRNELLAWLGNIPRVKRVGLNHGDVNAQQAFLAFARERGVAT